MPSNKMTIGNVEITSVTDGVLAFDLCNFFPGIPEERWENYGHHLNHDHQVEFNLACFVIRSESKTIAVDTGKVPNVDGKSPWGQLMDNLRANGIPPEDIDMVVHTHLHRDHIGWNLNSKDGKYEPTFPNARYWASVKDWEACHDPALVETRFPNAPECVWPLEDLGLIEFMDGEFPLTSELTTLPTPGHTPGHMSIMINSGGERGIILGDVLHNAVQVHETDWVSRADIDPATTRVTRRDLMERLEREGIPVAAVHMAAPGFGRIVRLDNRRVWQVL